MKSKIFILWQNKKNIFKKFEHVLMVIYITFAIILVIYFAVLMGKYYSNNHQHNLIINMRYLHQNIEEYYLETIKIIEIDEELHSTKKNHFNANKLQWKKKQLIANHQEISKKLKNILYAYKTKFDKNVQRQIPVFIQWLDSIDQKIRIFPINLSWQNLHDTNKEKLLNALKMALKNTLEQQQQVEIMTKVPLAEFNLKYHANDPKLCTVMQHFYTTKQPQKIAEQITFMNLGHIYCDQYYTKKLTWGNLAIFDKKTKDNGYDYFSYEKYYENYVKPKIAKAIRKYQDTKNNFEICVRQGINFASIRDPEQDALRQAYLQVGHQYCPLQLQRNFEYTTTPYWCIQHINFFAEDEQNQDVIERCKITPGVLFKDIQ